MMIMVSRPSLDAMVVSSRYGRERNTREAVRVTPHPRALSHRARLRRARLRRRHRPRPRASRDHDSSISTRPHARDASTNVQRDDDTTANEKYSSRCAVRARLERDARAVVRDDRSSRPRPALGSPRPPPRDPTLDGVLARRARSTPVGTERTHRSRASRLSSSRRSRRHAPSSLVLASKREVEAMASPSRRRRARVGRCDDGA